MNECAVAKQSHANEQHDPLKVSLVELGICEHVATNLVSRYDAELLQFTINEVSRRADRLVSPAAFIVWWLGKGLAQRHFERFRAAEEQREARKNEPLAPYHRKWSEMKALYGYEPVVIDREEWERGLAYLRQVLRIDEATEPQVHCCVTCGRETTNPYSNGMCSRCFEDWLKQQMSSRKKGEAL
jgi:hypothetical protein